SAPLRQRRKPSERRNARANAARAADVAPHRAVNPPRLGQQPARDLLAGKVGAIHVVILAAADQAAEVDIHAAISPVAAAMDVGTDADEAVDRRTRRRSWSPVKSPRPTSPQR